ncbi:MAG: DUF503 domain-containing protein [Eubacteriaceae bacterium]|nr:DUF503 domain-containing protein [Eubacteriaceae bacterium]
MIIGTATIKLDIPFAHSLKDKRMVVKSVISKVQNKFKISIAETDEMDTIQTAVISFICIAANAALADSITENVISYIEDNTDAEVILLSRENIIQ